MTAVLRCPATSHSGLPGGVGTTWALEDFVSLVNDVESKIFGRFDDDAHVYPGHGSDTTLGEERPHIAEWRERGW